MTRYRISQDGEPVAIVASLDLARGLARGQPPGHYAVDELQGGSTRRDRAAARRRAIRHLDGRKPSTQSDRKIGPSHRPRPLPEEAGGESV